MNALSLAIMLLPGAALAKDLTRDPVLFHSGARVHMETNIREGNVPLTAWKEFVMGKTNFDLPDYRKGLYGAEELSGTGLYSLYRTLGGGEPWVIVVRLKKECLGKPALFSEEYLLSKEASRRGRFHDWYWKNRSKYRHLEKSCWREKDEGYGYWETGALYDLAGADPETQRLTRLCTPVLKDFLDATGVKVFFDAVNHDSWGIRDRSCIEGISGSADELFRRMITNDIGNKEEDFVRNFYGSFGSPGLFYAGNTLLFLAAAAETSLLDAKNLPRMAKLRAELKDWIGPELKQPKELTLEANGDNPQLLLLTLEAIERAVTRGTAAELQSQLRSFLSSLRQKLGAACDGKRGVKPERREACSAETDRLTQELLGLLGSGRP